MARLKRGSTVLQAAKERLAGLRSITPPPNFGPGLGLDEYEQDINEVSEALDNYNQQLAVADQLLNALKALERKLSDKSKRMLSATGAQFGTNSSQYEQAGGTRDDERKKPTRKTPSKG